MNVETGDIIRLPKDPAKASSLMHVPAGQDVPAGTYLKLTEEEEASFKAPDITESERARRLCSILKDRIKAEMKAANWPVVTELRQVLAEAKDKHRAIVKGKVKAAAQ